MSKIGVMTSGGDAPGMNAAVRAVVRKGISSGYDIVGIQRGYAGLLSGNQFLNLEIGSVADIIHRGGTVLLTARAPEMLDCVNQDKAAEILKSKDIEKLIIIGGEGSFRGAIKLQERGVKVIGIPGTIDNDIPGTDKTIGFDTAVNTILDAINRLRDTATSHERIFLLEVMGRQNGLLALTAGLAGGAESILIPEVDYDIEEVCKRIMHGIKRKKTHSIILVAEGAGDVYKIKEQVSNQINTEIRVTVLGHVQRGGTPSAVDRLLGSRMGAMAVDLLHEGKSGLFTASRGDDVIALPLEKCFERTRSFPEEIYQLALVLAK